MTNADVRNTMNSVAESFEDIHAGQQVRCENVREAGLSLSIELSDGSHIELELAPGQSFDFAAGASDARIVLHRGDPAALLVIKPELPS